MNYVHQGTAPHLKPRREELLKRTSGSPMRPEAGRPSTPTRTRRQSLSGVLAALSRRNRTVGLPGPRSRESAGSGISPIASGVSRGVAILGSR